ncbi:cytochrome C oxidase subunit II [Bacillus sp. AFS040349]|uniref:cytochrome C oxidase subunit II n=1 Tax=Bacillus sp. AFS040349 TaxID=2033502 RepID=UPI0021002AA2|nr:cytochrome C oxidase subunit II [Bacillus sp. AFS040349]
MKQKSLFLFLLLAMMFVLAACSGGEDTNQDTGMEENAGQGAENGEGTTDEGTTDGDGTEDNGDAAANAINISAVNWEFDKEEYMVKAGEPVTLNFKSEEGVHGLAIEGTDINIQQDGQQEVTLEPGEYKVYCSIPCGQGHANMTATLVVQ